MLGPVRSFRGHIDRSMHSRTDFTAQFDAHADPETRFDAQTDPETRFDAYTGPETRFDAHSQTGTSSGAQIVIRTSFDAHTVTEGEIRRRRISRDGITGTGDATTRGLSYGALSVMRRLNLNGWDEG